MYTLNDSKLWSDSKQSLEEEEQLLAMNALCDAWENDEDLSYGTMADQLDALATMMEQKTSYTDFINVTQIKNNFIN